MGLTISYTLSARGKPAERLLAQMVECTAQFARKIGCSEVHGPHFGGPTHWNMRKLPDGAWTGDQVSALEGWSVSVLPGDGCEPADFGLCRYPGIRGYQLSSCCKTQYAARHGVDYFLNCHRRVISLLDLWRDFGVGVDVCDEGEYWQKRSVEQLRNRILLYDHMLAAVAGALKDDADENTPLLKAEILSDARFERLEAEGREQYSSQVKEVCRILRDLQ